MQLPQIWYTNSLQDTPDTIHQVLAFGSLQQIQQLKKTLGIKMLQNIFLTHPKKVYTNATLHFIKQFILDIHKPINDQKYLKFTSRYIG